jgi:sigma-B regulation protein RsbU (phosphoserine phosphatase)
MSQLEDASREHSTELGLQLFRNLLEHTSDSVYFKDLASHFIRISNRQARNYGLKDPGEAVGKTDSDFFAPDHALAARRDEEQIIKSGQPIIGKEEHQTWPDGHRTWVSTSKMPLRDDAGEIIGTFGISRDITKRKEAEEALRKSEESLRMALEAMERELDRARIIQRALLPPPPPAHPFLDIGSYYEPLEAIGGDYYSLAPLNGDTLSLFIGDVMGHGVSAALFMALLKFITDRLVAEHGYDPKAYLKEVNFTLMDQMPMSFATGIYGYFERGEDPSLVKLAIAGAGHPPPLLYRARTGAFELVSLQGNAALGLTDQFSTEPIRLTLARGDRLILYTDGFTEASNDHDEMLGNDRLVELAGKSIRPTMDESLAALIEGLNRFRGSSPLDDDILLIGFQVR